jgi:hypothetical protein
MTDQEIHKFCDTFKIINYTINDGIVDVNGSVYISSSPLTKLPVRFGIVTEEFECGHNNLTTLEGCPSQVGDYFACNGNQLTSLEPQIVGGDFYCDDNKLIDLTGCPKELGGDLYCEQNPIGSIFTNVRIDFLTAFNTYKVIKDGQVNLKRLKYVMELFNQSIDFKEIRKFYRIV